MSALAELVLPAIRWDAERGFAAAVPDIERAIDAGVGGFILFGGERDEVRKLARGLQAASKTPLLIASDLERGAGQQVRGLTQLPPPLALASSGLDDVMLAAILTALEARSVGINWVFAPVLDLDVEPANPIVQTRSLGEDPSIVGALGSAWIEQCQSEGVLACAKHFPGHGRTTTDSHAELPVVNAGRPTLERDLAPFHEAIAAGVASVMTAHVAYPALDASGGPATYSREIITGLLREAMGFDGLVVTDALIMEGAQSSGGEAEGAVRAVAAGCDLLLYPRDVAGAVRALEAAVSSGELERERVERARQRRESAVKRAMGARHGALPEPAVIAVWERALLGHAPRPLRGSARRLAGRVEIEVVDDDAGGPYPLPPREVFGHALRELGVQVGQGGDERVVLLFADVKGWKGRAGLSTESRSRLAELLARPATVVLFGHPRRLAEIPGDHAVLCAWSGDEAMQRAAARRLAEG